MANLMRLRVRANEINCKRAGVLRAGRRVHPAAFCGRRACVCSAAVDGASALALASWMPVVGKIEIAGQCEEHNYAGHKTRHLVVVVAVFILNRPFYQASSVHPVSVLIPYPRDMLILWSQTTVRQRKTKNKTESQIQVSSK